jgi:hypothetical protein
MKERRAALTWVVAVVVIVSGMVFPTAVQLTAQSASRFSGTWRLNVMKSKFMPGPTPKSGVLKVEQTTGGRHSIVETMAPDGSTDRSEYTAPLDGKDHPLKGSGNADTVSLRQVNQTTIERTDKRRGQVVMLHTLKMSPDGRTLTVNVKGVTGAGDHVDNLMVWDRQ